MYIALKWVNELVNIEDFNLEDLIEKLTLGGFEVEETLELKIRNKKTLVLNISATANRSDSLSVKGISKEIAALTDKSYRKTKYLTQNFDWELQIKNSSSSHIQSTDYSTFVTFIVKNVTNFSTPAWLKDKLISSGLIPVNNLLDFQNYILLETGYPFEFYDLDKIYSKLGESNLNLTLGPAGNNEHFLANNNLEYKLNNTITILKANNLTLSIAGIISNKDFSYTNQTKNLLIEGTTFKSKNIRQQSRILGLRTNRSARYEKGLNDSFLIESFYRLLSLLKVLNPNLICQLHTISETGDKSLQNIFLKYENINETLGPVFENFCKQTNYITPTQISKYLQRLDFNFSFNKREVSWKVKIPSSRSEDLTREIDLIEEIGRLHGFNNFVTSLPKLKKIGLKDFSYQTRKKLTSCFLSQGFNELIEYSLVSEKTFLTNNINLINPLLSDCSNLRSSILPNLIKTVNENVKQGNFGLEGFEYGHVFSGNSVTNFIEKEKIGGIFGGIKTKTEWSDLPKSLSWFEGKGKLEQIFKRLNLVIYWKNSFPSLYQQILHPYRTAELCLVDGKILGVFGQINPILAKKRNLSTDLYLFEFDFKLLKNTLQNTKLPVYKHYSVYPKIIKDLSFIVNQNISFDQIKQTIIENGTHFLIQIKLLDEYRGQSIPINHTSLCIQLIFQSNEKTLINKEVEEIVTNLQLQLTKQYNVISRS
jgi:phenylalanyl-tRNA synthetase beta chain